MVGASGVDRRSRCHHRTVAIVWIRRDLRVGASTIPSPRSSRTRHRVPHPPRPGGQRREPRSLDHFVARGSFVANPRDDFHAARPAVPDARRRSSAPLPAPALGEHTETAASIGVPPACGNPRVDRPSRHDARRRRLPLSGVRVLDLTAFWAGPVVHPHAGDARRRGDPRRVAHAPDGTRLIAGMPFTDDQWWERCGIFSAPQHRQEGRDARSARRSAAARLRTLIATCDVLVENFTPRVSRSARPRFRGGASDSAATSSWCACPASASTGRGATTLRSLTSSRRRQD